MKLWATTIMLSMAGASATAQEFNPTGHWHDPYAESEGFQFQVIDSYTGPALATYFYGKDSSGQPYWLVGVTNKSVGVDEEIKVSLETQTNDPYPSFATIKFNDCWTGEVKLYERGFGPPAYYNNLQRLTSVQGIPCTLTRSGE